MLPGIDECARVPGETWGHYLEYLVPEAAGHDRPERVVMSKWTAVEIIIRRAAARRRSSVRARPM